MLFVSLSLKSAGDRLVRYPCNREFKKLRLLSQEKCHFKIELSARLSVLRLFHVGHVVHWFSCKVRTSDMKILGRRASKGVPHVQHGYFSSFNQSNHWFVALSLPSSFHRLPDVIYTISWHFGFTFSKQVYELSLSVFLCAMVSCALSQMWQSPTVGCLWNFSNILLNLLFIVPWYFRCW